MSEIIRALAIRNGRLKPEDETDLMPLVVGIGCAMEEWAVGLYPNLWWQPGELQRDGIIGTPDGLSGLGEDLVIEEFKATYKSNRHRESLDNEWMWMMQVMSYLNMNEWRPVHARFHVFWMANDYKMPFRPQYIRYLYEFGALELNECWKTMVKHKELAA